MTANLSNSEPEVAASTDEAEQFRRLKSNELVSRADAFVQQIYRQADGRSITVKQSK